MNGSIIAPGVLYSVGELSPRNSTFPVNSRKSGRRNAAGGKYEMASTASISGAPAGERQAPEDVAREARDDQDDDRRHQREHEAVDQVDVERHDLEDLRERRRR